MVQIGLNDGSLELEQLTRTRGIAEASHRRSIRYLEEGEWNESAEVRCERSGGFFPVENQGRRWSSCTECESGNSR